MPQGVDIGSFVGSNFDGDKAVKSIIKAEKKKQTPSQNYKFLYTMKKEAWQGLQKKLSDLNSASKNLYSPMYSPFRKTTALSSDESSISIAKKNVNPKKFKPGKYSITPKQKADKSHFISDNLNADMNLNPAQFEINYQNKKYTINFSGGNLQKLADAINQVAGDFLTASIISTGNNNSVLDIEGKKIGKDFKIDIQSKSPLLKQIGLITNKLPEYHNLNITDRNNLSSNKDIDILLSHKYPLLQKKDFIKKKFPKALEADSQSQLWLYLQTSSNNKKSPKSNKSQNDSLQKKQPIQGFIDKIWVGDSDLHGEALLASLDVFIPQPSKKNENNNQPNDAENAQNSSPIEIQLEYSSNGQNTIIKKQFNPSSKKLEIVKIPLQKGSLKSVAIYNLSSNSVEIQKAELVNLNRGKLTPKHHISKAQNALVNYKGVDYERPNNLITDIIPGIELKITHSSKNPVSINLDWDYDNILKSIQTWVITYNNMIDYIKNTTSRNKENLKMGRSYMSEIEEKKKEYDKLSRSDKQELAVSGELYQGVLASEFSVNALKRKIQSVITMPYKTDAKKNVMFLSQLGIKRPSMADIAVSASEEEKLNYQAGYLDFTKDGQTVFLNQLEKYYHSVQQLFFDKSGKSIIYNKGLAVNLNHTIEKIISSSSGIIKNQIKTLNSKIEYQKKQLKEMDDNLKDQERQLRKQFGKVYTAQRQAQAMENQLKGFNNNR